MGPPWRPPIKTIEPFVVACSDATAETAPLCIESSRGRDNGLLQLLQQPSDAAAAAFAAQREELDRRATEGERERRGSLFYSFAVASPKALGIAL